MPLSPCPYLPLEPAQSTLPAPTITPTTPSTIPSTNPRSSLPVTTAPLSLDAETCAVPVLPVVVAVAIDPALTVLVGAETELRVAARSKGALPFES